MSIQLIAADAMNWPLASVTATMLVYRTGSPNCPRRTCRPAARNVWRFEPTKRMAEAGSKNGAAISPATASASDELASPKPAGFGAGRHLLRRCRCISRMVEYLQKISCAGQIGIKANEHASSDRPDCAFDHAGEILDDCPKSIRQCRIAINCLVTEADSPRTVMNDIPGGEYRAKPLNSDPAGGMCQDLVPGTSMPHRRAGASGPRRAVARR